MPPAPAVVAGEARAYQASAIYVYPYEDFASVRALRYPNWGSMVGVRSVTGYDAFIPVRYGRVMGAMESTGFMTNEEVWQPGHHGFALFGVRTLLLDPLVAAEPAVRHDVAAKGYRLQSSEARARFFVNPHVLPRAWRLTHTVAAAPLEVERHVTADPAFVPAHLGYLDAPAPKGTWSDGTVVAHSPDFNTILLDTRGAGPGFVAVSESYDPGWRAFVAAPGGDRELPVTCLDAVILGVAVPAGDRRVTLRYEPRTWHAGEAGSLCALLLWGLWAWRDRRRARSPLP